MLPSFPQISVKPDDSAFRAMFAARKQVFIDLLKWDLPVLAGLYELDQFDTSDAEYLILTDLAGGHRASTRLLRTEGPHLLGDLFSSLCDGPIPSGPQVREITRFCLDPHQTARERRSARNQLVTALVEYALAHGIAGYTGVAEVGWFDQIRQFGWQCDALGPVVHMNGQRLRALYIEIDHHTMDGLRGGGVYEPTSLNLIGTVGGHA